MRYSNIIFKKMIDRNAVHVHLYTGQVEEP